MKRYWADMRSVMRQNNKKNSGINSVIRDGIRVTDKYGNQTAFNEHFATVLNKLECELSPPDHVSPTSLIPAQPNLLYLYPVTHEECEQIILGLKIVIMVEMPYQQVC